MKPVYLIVLSLPFISGFMQDHRKTTSRATTARKDPAVHALNMDQSVLGADDNRCYTCSSPCSRAVCCHGDYPQCCSDGVYCYCCAD